MTIWKPNTTVAAIIERDGRFLLVEEETAEGVRLNQPAGHLEDTETLIDGVIRETREETAYEFRPEALLGVYHWRHPTRTSPICASPSPASWASIMPIRHWILASCAPCG
jgi:8-oxo-dGTP pyrophosphatase MutT (NUDIX family)